MEANGTRGRRWAPWAAYGFVAFVACLAWWRVLGLELLGWDSYPLIAAGRIGSLRELFTTAAEPLMDGRYPLGAYWRPVVHYSFALDYALWGLRPWGYHSTDLLLVVANALLVAALVRRPMGAKWAAAAGAYFAVHAVHLDVLPAPARRADALALLFTLAALLAARSFATRPFVRRGLVAACCALALMSKETGAVAVVLVVLLHALRAPVSARAARARHVLAESWPAVAAFAAAFAARTAVLGGLGGARESSLDAALRDAPSELLRYAPAVLAPPIFRVFGAWPAWLTLGVAIAIALVLRLALRTLRRAGRTEQAASARRGLAFCCAWYVALVAITALSGAERGWYELPFAALGALFVCLVFWTLQMEQLAKQHSNRRAALGALALAVLCWPIYFGWNSMRSGLEAASATQRAFLERFESAVRGATPGERVVVPGFVAEIACSAPALDGRQRTLTLLAPYSVQAYAELVFGAGRVALVDPRQPGALPPGAVGVVLAR